jgi:hypothetical protein
MLTKCANPSCLASFLHLADGRLFRLETDPPFPSSNAGYVSPARPGRHYVWPETEQWRQSDWQMLFVTVPTSPSTRWIERMGNSSAALAFFPEAIRKAREKSSRGPHVRGIGTTESVIENLMSMYQVKATM